MRVHGPTLLVPVSLLVAACSTQQHGGSTMTFAASAPDTASAIPNLPVADDATSTAQLFEAHPRGDLTAPRYPAAALKEKLRTVRIPMKITVGTDGKVTRVSRSPALLAVLIPHLDQFEAAIRMAVSDWDFWPARIIDGEVDATTGLGSLHEELIEMSFDFEFVFEQDATVSIASLKQQTPSKP